MEAECDVVEVSPVVLAVAEATLPRREIPARILGLFDRCYTWVRGAEVKRTGQNYAVYDQCTDESLRMRAGFPVSASFADTGQVQCMTLAGGRAAHTAHVGPYDRMQSSYERLHAWCKREGLAGSGESWEVYGDWSDDPSKLVTDLYLRLRACG